MIQSLPDDILFYIAEFIIPVSYVKQLCVDRMGPADYITTLLVKESNYTNSSIPIQVFREHMSELTLAYLKLYPHETCRDRELYIQPKLLYMLTYLMDPHIDLPPFQEIEVKKEKDYYIRHIIQCVQYYKSRRHLSYRESHVLLMNYNLEKEIKQKETYYHFLIHSILSV
jgi:hypothetical protein